MFFPGNGKLPWSQKSRPLLRIITLIHMNKKQITINKLDGMPHSPLNMDTALRVLISTTKPLDLDGCRVKDYLNPVSFDLLKTIPRSCSLRVMESTHMAARTTGRDIGPARGLPVHFDRDGPGSAVERHLKVIDRLASLDCKRLTLPADFDGDGCGAMSGRDD